MFWFTYFSLSIFLIYLITKLFDNIFLKVLFSNIFLGLLIGVWFISPGSEKVAPIFSIFLLEATILENNGLGRLLRPLIAIIFTSSLLSFIYIRLRAKN